jgi:EAL domain-containing protein (putative c-di-GMP-specific phosphodiesterase class I)
MKIGGKYLEGQVRWYLEAATENNAEWMFAIDPIPFIIGRDESCNLKLTDKCISRYQCEINTSADYLWIRDLTSTNGTFVNHEKIKRAELLEEGDIISLGKFKFLVKKYETGHSTANETCAMDVSEELKHLASFDSRLQEILRKRAVIPYFQPIISFSDSTVIGYEVLGRILDDKLPSDPAELFDMAEWLGCDSELSSVFREVGVEIGRKLPGSPVLFVNTTPLEVVKLNLLLESLGKIHGMALLNRVVLEINEKAATNGDQMSTLRKALRKWNIGLAFDDFGAGQTRLVELAKTPPDFLKFDISLIRQIHLAPKRLHQMVLTFVKAAHDLGILTLAEGIENRDEAETCQQLGFNYAQGFHYGRPMPITEMIAG